jgi:hypothetical protein
VQPSVAGSAAREVLDFIDFLIQHRLRLTDTPRALQVRDSRQFLTAIADGKGDVPNVFDDADLGHDISHDTL